jgi:hypothetical protein
VSPEQIVRVRANVTRLAGHADELAGALTVGLATHAPTALRLLPDPDRAGQAVMRQLQAFADAADDFPRLQAWAHDLGSATGTPASATEMVGIGAALVDAIDDVLGPEFSTEDREAWRAGVALVSELVR